MSCSVNLVPAAQSQERSRRRRQNSWIVVGTVAAVMLVAGWGLHQTVAAALARLSTNADALDLQRADVQRRLMVAAAERDGLLEQLKTLADARRPQPWARRLMDLTHHAPDGVFLTAIDIATPMTQEAAEPEQGTTVEQRGVRLRGYALDHGALIQMLNTLQDLPGWQQVELVRATREPFRNAHAVAFELACQTQEGRP